MTADKISFTSRINFVDSKSFEKFRHGAYVDFKKIYQPTKHELWDYEFARAFGGEIKKFPRFDVVKSDEFYTDEVRTCSAGGVIDFKTGQCAGFHFYDNLENSQQTDDMLDAIFKLVPNPDRALLLGSKKLKFSIYSISIFDKILEGLNKRIKNITVFREHIFPYSESDLHYSLKDDTWTIRSMFRPLTDYKEYDILSKETLEKSFKEIKLADGDCITFSDKNP